MAITIIFFIATTIKKHLLPAAMHMVLYSVWFYKLHHHGPHPWEVEKYNGIIENGEM